MRERRTSGQKGVLFVVQTDDACAIIVAAIIDGQPALFVASVAAEGAI